MQHTIEQLARIIREKVNGDKFPVATKHDCDEGRICLDRMTDSKAVSRI